jgi:hypothetical protein
VACDDLLVRDAVLAGLAHPDRSRVLAFLIQLTRHAVPPYDAQVSTMLAWVAYSCGDGALANVALDRALGTDPGHSMGRLVRDMLDAGMPPEVLRAVSLATAEELGDLVAAVDAPSDGAADGRPTDEVTAQPAPTSVASRQPGCGSGRE